MGHTPAPDRYLHSTRDIYLTPPCSTLGSQCIGVPGAPNGASKSFLNRDFAHQTSHAATAAAVRLRSKDKRRRPLPAVRPHRRLRRRLFSFGLTILRKSLVARPTTGLVSCGPPPLTELQVRRAHCTANGRWGGRRPRRRMSPRVPLSPDALRASPRPWLCAV